MAERVGINGFGRIAAHYAGALGDKHIDFVAVNDLTNAATLAHLLKYDPCSATCTQRSRRPKTPSPSRRRVQGPLERDPAQLPWKDLGVEIVFESTGSSTGRDDAAKHITAGRAEGRHYGPAKGTRKSQSSSACRTT